MMAAKSDEAPSIFRQTEIFEFLQNNKQRFININELFKCVICKSILANPQNLECTCKACKLCLDKYLENNKFCPGLNRGCHSNEIDIGSVISSDITISKINKLIFKCFNERCQYEGKIEDLVTHIKSCNFKSNCPLKKSGFEIKLSDTMNLEEYTAHANLFIEMNQNLKNEIDELKKDELDSNQKMETKFEVLKLIVNNIHSKNIEKDLVIETLKNENESMKADIEYLKNENETRKQETEDLRTENVNMKKDIDDLKTENAKRKKDIDDEKCENIVKHTIWKQAIIDLINDKRKIERIIEKLETDAMQKEELIDGLENKNENNLKLIKFQENRINSVIFKQMDKNNIEFSIKNIHNKFGAAPYDEYSSILVEPAFGYSIRLHFKFKPPNEQINEFYLSVSFQFIDEDNDLEWPCKETIWFGFKSFGRQTESEYGVNVLNYNANEENYREITYGKYGREKAFETIWTLSELESENCIYKRDNLVAFCRLTL